MSALLPWHHDAWQRLSQAIAHDRLAHALLVAGATGVGKTLFVDALVARVLCERPSGDKACDTCRSCQLRLAGTHPDLLEATIIEGKTGIGVDQVREVIDYFTLMSHYGQRKIAIIRPADAMNRSTSNALLKILEEPPAGALIILQTARPEALLPTLRSRCLRLALKDGRSDIARAWMREQRPELSESDCETLLWITGGGPLAALQAKAEDWLASLSAVQRAMLGVSQGRVHATQAAEGLAGLAVTRLLDFMALIVHASLWRRLGGATPAPPGLDLNAASDALHSSALSGFLDDVWRLKAQAIASATLRPSDLADEIWLAWMKRTRPSKNRASTRP